MYEQLRNDMLVALSNMQGVEVTAVIQALDQVALNYDIKRKETGMVVYNSDFPELVKIYLVCKKMAGLADQTLNSYKLILGVFFRHIQKPPEMITANEIRAFLYVYQTQKNVSLRTIDKYREYITRFFTWAHDEGYIKNNPARNIVGIKYEEKPREALTQIELEYLRMACKTLRETAIIEFLYSTGCRVSELSSVKKTDVNWYEKSVHLFGKGKKHRTSFLNAKAEVALKKYLENRNDDCDYLFVSAKRPVRNLQKDGIEKIVRNIAQRASDNIDKHITPHVLRHTFSSQALQNGMPISDVSKLLGHESVETTMIYIHSSTDEIRANHKKYVV